MNAPGDRPSWEYLAAWLVVSVIVLELAASVLPRLVVPVVILAVVFVLVRLIWHYTQL